MNINDLKRDMVTTEMPDDLRTILDKYIELHDVANQCNHNILDSGFEKSLNANCSLNFDLKKEKSFLYGHISLDTLIEHWEEHLRLSSEMAAVSMFVCYTHMVDQWKDMTSKIENFLKPLSETGWSTLVTRKESSYEVKAALSSVVMMGGYPYD